MIVSHHITMKKVKKKQVMKKEIQDIYENNNDQEAKKKV